MVLNQHVCEYQIGNCNIDFLNFHHCQVQNFEILNLYEQNWNFGVIFESTKSKTKSQQSTLKLQESLVLNHWNFMKCH